jgi:hypothetical protein
MEAPAKSPTFAPFTQRRSRETSATRVARLLLVCGSIATAIGTPAPLALAQEHISSQPTAQIASRAIDPLDITGQTFANVRLPLAPSAGKIEFRGIKAWSWTDADPASSATCRRLFLEGDVHVQLGVYDFDASKAVVWLEPIGTGPKGGPLWQAFVYLDRVSMPMDNVGVAMSSDSLPVQGVIELPIDDKGASTGIALKADRVTRERAIDPLVDEGERALAQRLLRILAPPPALGAVPPDDLLARGELIPTLRGTPTSPPIDRNEIETAEKSLGPASRDEPIFAKSGTFSFSAGHLEVISGTDDNSIVLSGRVSIQYWDRAKDRTLQLSSERAVVFLDPGPIKDMDAAHLDAGKVRGVYLEGDVVASDGRFNLRSPRIFYSVREGRAIVLDAVFWTYDERKGLPLYVRAKTISQESATEFRATSARLTNTAFFEPDFSIGASSVTITRRPSDKGDERLYVDARDITLRAGNIPFFYWPIARGEANQPPLKDLRFENSNGSGAAIKTTWNTVTLLGGKASREFQSDLMLDDYLDRGFAAGTNTRWYGENNAGNLFVYGLADDRGKDVTPTGYKKQRDGEVRGVITGEHRAQLDDHWTLFAEGSYISDPTFIDGFFSPLASARREYTSSLEARRLENNTAFTANIQGSFNHFIPNQYLLQSPGYGVEKLPEFTYQRFADNVLDEYPGLLTYSSEYRATYMRMRMDRIPAQDRGFLSPFQSQSAFGILPGQSIADALKAQGLSESPVGRADTRHELDMPLAAGPVNITPFVAARGTAYTQDFHEYAPENDDKGRLWGSIGATASTEVQRVYNDTHSRLLDLNRVRHIIRPSASFWYAGATMKSEDLPVYDPEVESLQTGAVWRLALDQTFQTQRGGPGRWRSVDVLTWNTELVLPSGDTDKTSTIGHYYDARPEYSALGDNFIHTDATWQASEILGFTGDLVYDFRTSQLARSVIGVTLQHTPDFNTYAELRSIGALDETFANFGVSYQITSKYSISSEASYNMDKGEIQTINAEFRRRFPNVVLGVGISYNNITAQTSFGFVLQPLGVGNGSVRANEGATGAARGFVSN